MLMRTPQMILLYRAEASCWVISPLAFYITKLSPSSGCSRCFGLLFLWWLCLMQTLAWKGGTNEIGVWHISKYCKWTRATERTVRISVSWQIPGTAKPGLIYCMWWVNLHRITAHCVKQHCPESCLSQRSPCLHLSSNISVANIWFWKCGRWLICTHTHKYFNYSYR